MNAVIASLLLSQVWHPAPAKQPPMPDKTQITVHVDFPAKAVELLEKSVDVLERARQDLVEIKTEAKATALYVREKSRWLLPVGIGIGVVGLLVIQSMFRRSP